MDKHLVRRLAILAVFLVVLFGGIFGWRAFVAGKTRQAMAKMGHRTVTVATTRVQKVDWPAELHATASLKAVQGASLTPQIAGMVTSIDFHSGAKVREGKLLVQLNDATQRAKLRTDESALKLAKTKLAQQRMLYRRHNTSELALQEASTGYTQAQAAVSADRATIAKLQVRAPFTGHLGLRKVSLGQYLTVSTPVVDLQQWDPIYAEFQIPQQQLARLSQGETVTVTVAGLEGRSFTGTLTAIGSALQPGTRNVSAQAKLKNPDNVLRPGMYGEVTVRTGRNRRVLAVPDSAVTYNTYGEYVYVIEKGLHGKLVARERNVRTGESRNGLTVVTRGLKVGDRVVTAGQVKLHPGAEVTISKSATTAAEAISTATSGGAA